MLAIGVFAQKNNRWLAHRDEHHFLDSHLPDGRQGTVSRVRRQRGDIGLHSQLQAGVNLEAADVNVEPYVCVIGAYWNLSASPQAPPIAIEGAGVSYPKRVFAFVKNFALATL